MEAQKPYPKKLKVKVVNKSGSPNMYQVDKLKGSKKAQETFTWIAPDDSDITIFFPPVDDPLAVGSQHLIKAKDTFEVKLTSARLTHGGGDDNPYRYAVYCHKTHTFAEGNSAPEIIIDE